MEFDGYLVLALAIIFFSTLTRSTFGFGDALIAMPLLSLIFDFDFTRPLVALISLTISLCILSRQWHRMSWASGGWLLLSAAIGVPFGFFFLAACDERVVKVALAVVLIGFSGYSLWKPRAIVVTSDRSAFPFGFFAGVLAGAYNTPGPPLVVYGSMRDWPPETFRATMHSCFLVTSSLILLGHAVSGRFVGRVFWYYLLALPVVIFSIFLGSNIAHRLRGPVFVRYVHGLLIVIGVALLAQSLRSWGTM